MPGVAHRLRYAGHPLFQSAVGVAALGAGDSLRGVCDLGALAVASEADDRIQCWTKAVIPNATAEWRDGGRISSACDQCRPPAGAMLPHYRKK
jgi:hypothetical protein